MRYFSGAATYRESLDVPAEMLGRGRRWYLDLGRVEVLAEPKLNGQALDPAQVQVPAAAAERDLRRHVERRAVGHRTGVRARPARVLAPWGQPREHDPLATPQRAGNYFPRAGERQRGRQAGTEICDGARRHPDDVVPGCETSSRRSKAGGSPLGCGPARGLAQQFLPCA